LTPNAPERRLAPGIISLASVIAGIAGSLVIWGMMSHGPGVSPDSAIYIGTAENLLAGRGLVLDGAPMNHFPPLYPLMLALGGWFTHDAIRAAKVLAALAFGANIVVVGWAVQLATRRNAGAVLAAILLFGVSESALYLHGMAWSEAPFLFFTLSGLLVLAAGVSRGKRSLLILGAVFFALAMVTRYAGMMLVIPLTVAAVLPGYWNWRERLRNALAMNAVALAPLGACMIRNHLVAHGATDRVVAMHLVDAGLLTQLVTTLNDYLLPTDADVWAKGALVLCVAVMLVWGLITTLRSERRRSTSLSIASTLSLLSLVFIGAYIAFLLVSISFLDATTPLDDRILFPVFGIVVVAMVVIAWRLARRLRRRAIWLALVACAAVSIAVRGPSALSAIGDVRRDGVGYTSDGWKHSDMLAQVRRLPADLVVYSNAQDAIEFLTGRAAEWLPDDELWESAQPNPEFARQRDAMCGRVMSGNAVVAYFITDDPGDEWALDQVAKMCTFPMIIRRADGKFYSASALGIDSVRKTR
jgi:hypothetical protein